MTTFTDDFTAAVEEGLEVRPGWTRSGGAANNVRATTAGEARNLATDATGTAYLAPSTGSVSHYAEGRIVTGALGTGAGFPFICRLQDPNNWPAGLRSNGTGSLQVFQRSAGTLTQLGANITLTPSLTSADVFRIEVAGTTATIYRNGVSLGTRAISGSINPSGTQPGLLGRTDARTNWIDDWASGPVSAATTGAAELTGSVSLDAQGRVRLRGAAELAVAATMDAAAIGRVRGAAELATAATLDAAARLRLRGAAELQATVTVDAAAAGGGARAELALAVTMDAAGRVRLRGAAELAGAATLDAAARLRLRGAAALTLSVTCDAAGVVRSGQAVTPLPRSVVRALPPAAVVAGVAPVRVVAGVRPVQRVKARAA